MTKIALCLALRNGSRQAADAIKSFKDLANDKDLPVYIDMSPAKGAAVPIERALQAAYRNPDIQLFVVAADDVVCTTPGWDRILLDKHALLAKHGDARVYMADEGRKSGELLCHPVFTRAWIDVLGYAVPQGYTHYYSDTDVERVARLAHCLHYVPEYRIDHRIGSADADWRPAKLALMNGDQAHYRTQKERQERDAAKLRDFNAHCKV